MKKNKKDLQKNAPEKNPGFKIGDLVRVLPNAHFVEEEFVGAPGLIIAFNATGYPKGFSGRAKDDIMYVVAAQGRNIKLFEDEIEIVA